MLKYNASRVSPYCANGLIEITMQYHSSCSVVVDDSY